MKKIFGYIVVLLFSTSIIRLLNFIKEIQISYFYGTGTEIDKYNVILIIPNLMLNSIGPALGLVIISLVSTNKSVISLQKKDVYFLTTLSFLLIIASIPISLAIGPFDFLNVAFILLITFLFFIQVSLVYYIQAFNEFKIGSISSLLQIIVNILFIFLSFFIRDSYVLSLGLISGLFIQNIFLIRFISKKNYTRIIKIEKKEENEFINPVLSMFLGFGLIEVLISVQKIFIGTSETEGAISGLNYAYKVMNLPISIFLFAILSGLFPTLIKIKEKSKFENYFKITLNTILFIMFPVSVLLYFFSYDLIYFLFERGEFGRESTLLTAFQLRLLSLLIVPLSILTVFLRFLYVDKKWKIIYKVTIAILIVHILSNIILLMLGLSNYLVISIPLSVMIGVLICYKNLNVSLVNSDQAKIVLGSIIMVLFTIKIEIEIVNIFYLMIYLGALIAIYLISQIIFKNSILNFFKKGMRK